MKSQIPLPPMFDARKLIGFGFVFKEDADGEAYVACERGRIVGVNFEDGSGCWAAVLTPGTPTQRRRLRVLNKKVLWENESELATEIGGGKMVRTLKILKPIEQPDDE